MASGLSFSGTMAGESVGSAVCKSPCAPGEYGKCSIATGSSSCYVDCSCHACSAGLVSAVAASISVKDCQPCSKPAFSTDGATSCNRCVEGYFMSLDGNCKAVPEQGCECGDGECTQDALNLAPGFWRAASSATIVHACPWAEACQGGNNYGIKGSGYCTAGYTGPL